MKTPMHRHSVCSSGHFLQTRTKEGKSRYSNYAVGVSWQRQTGRIRQTHAQLQPLNLTQSIGETAHIQAVILQHDYLTKVAAAVYGIEIPGHPFSSWMQELKRGNIDVFVALLLSQLPALENLDLGYGYLHRATFIPKMLCHLAFYRPTSFFPNLASITMAADAPYSPIGFWAHLDLTRPLFYLPSIHTIDAMMTEPVIFAWPSSTLIPNLPSLSRLVLRKATLMPRTLGKLLACTPRLQHLSYEHVRSVAWGSPQWADYVIYCPLRPYVQGRAAKRVHRRAAPPVRRMRERETAAQASILLLQTPRRRTRICEGYAGKSGVENPISPRAVQTYLRTRAWTFSHTLRYDGTP
jgi:hypothetical protein